MLLPYAGNVKKVKNSYNLEKRKIFMIKVQLSLTFLNLLCKQK